MNRSYRNISTISDVKYKGVHPIDKKRFIKNMNKKIDDFNKFWRGKSPEIEKLFNSGTKTIQDMLKKNDIELSEGTIEKAFADKEIQISDLDKAKILEKVSYEYCEKIKDLIEEITISNPKETLKDKTEKVNNFFKEFSENDTKIDEEIKSLIGHSLAKKFKPIAKKEKSTDDETKKDLAILVDRLIKNINKNEDMSDEDKKKFANALKKYRQSLTSNELRIKRQDISPLERTTIALAGADRGLITKFLKQQRESRKVKSLPQRFKLINNRLTEILQNTKTSNPLNVTRAVETVAQETKPKTEQHNEPTTNQTPPAPPKNLDPPPPPRGKKPETNQTKNDTSGQKSGDLLEDIRKGKKLKQVNKEDKNKYSKFLESSNDSDDLTGMLARAMARRNEEAKDEREEYSKRVEKEAEEWEKSEKESAKQTSHASAKKKQAPPLPPRGNKPAGNQTKKENEEKADSKKKSAKKAPQNEPATNQTKKENEEWKKETHEKLKDTLKGIRAATNPDEPDNEPEEEVDWD